MEVFKTVAFSGPYARSGVLKTRRGEVPTPTFMPDGTRGVVKSLTPEQVKSAGIDIVLANTYHLHLTPGEETVKKLGGLHGFGKWQGPILTDSGGFQIFSLSKMRKITEQGVAFKHPITGEVLTLTPETSIQIQLALGSDMIVAFDHLTGLDEKSIGTTLEAFERTHRWLERCVKEFKRLTKGMAGSESSRVSSEDFLSSSEALAKELIPDFNPPKTLEDKKDNPARPMLFGVVQGGLDLGLRAKSLEIVQNSGVDGIAIGGLSVGEPREEMYKVLEALAPLYDHDKPHFLLGVGEPEDIRFAIDHGIDMMDCVLPTRNARHATVWTTDDEKIHLTNSQYIADPDPIMEGCDCYTCSNGYSKGFLRHQFKVGEPLAGSLASIHNLRYLQRICESYR